MVALRAPEAPSSHVGERYGRLTVIRPLPPDGSGLRVLCICDCGEEREARVRYLIAGKARSCGCLRRAPALGAAEANAKYHRLTILEIVPAPGKQNGTFARCCCDCGKEKLLRYRYVVDGHTKSCGCLQREAATMARAGTETRKDHHGVLHAAARAALIAAGLLTVPVRCSGCERVKNQVHRETRLCPSCLDAADLLTCECGARKSLDRITSEGCDTCAGRDGSDLSGMAQRLVSALRVLGGEATQDALILETGIGYRSVWLSGSELIAAGLARAEPVEPDDPGRNKRVRYVLTESRA